MDSKRILKNTVLLYFRLIITLVVGLFTSRVILQSLGFIDFGIYNLVGGIVTTLAFLNVGMSGASQRFISYDLGRGDNSSLKNTFCTSFITHLSISAIIFIFMETIGLWFVNCQLNIPSDRMFAANWVFQCSIFVFAASVISVPYNSCIIAHEKMDMYAYISIFEVTMKLIIAFSILYTPTDKLILYSTLLLFLQVSINAIYIAYCKKKFEECTFSLHFDKKLFYEMFAFAGWGCIGNMGFTTKDQGSNILLNIFFGTTVNAAKGIANQVNAIISSFASNFTMAMNPQVTKLYSAGNLQESRKLAYAGSKYAFFLLSLLVIPFLINKHDILILWLGEIPEHTEAFVTIALICSLIYSMSNTISTAIMATGKVKWFQTGLSIILLMEIPLAYIVILVGGTPYQAMYPSVVTNFLSIIFRIIILHRILPDYNISEYFKYTIFHCFVVFSIALLVSYYIRQLFAHGIFDIVSTSLLAFIVDVIFIYIVGLSVAEKRIVKNKLLSYFRK